MDGFSPFQLEMVFKLCDQENKGFISAQDLKRGFTDTLNADHDTSDRILDLLRLGPDDYLDMEQFLSRVQEIYDVNENSHHHIHESEESELSSSANDMSLTKSRESTSSDETIGDGCKSGKSDTDDDIFGSDSPTRPIKNPRFLSSSRVALNLQRSRNKLKNRSCEEYNSSPEKLSKSFLSQSLNDLTDKVTALKDCQTESQDELRSILTRLSTTLNVEVEKRFEHFLTAVEEKISLKTRDSMEEKQLRCKLNKLEVERGNLGIENSFLRERVSELSLTLACKEEALLREKKENEDLTRKLARFQNDLNKLTLERNQQRSVHRSMMVKIEALTREKDELRLIRDVLKTEQLKIERERSRLAFESARLAQEKENMFGNSASFQYVDGQNFFNELESSVEEDSMVKTIQEAKALSEILPPVSIVVQSIETLEKVESRKTDQNLTARSKHTSEHTSHEQPRGLMRC